MVYSRALTYIFEDQDWIKKTLIGVLLTITVVGILAVMGYGFRTAQNIIKGLDNPLPDWNQWRNDFKNGLYLFIVLGLYSLPIFPLSVTCLLGILYSILLALVLPIIYIQCLSPEGFRAAFFFIEMKNILKHNFNEVLTAALISLGILLTLMLISLTFIGVLLVPFGITVSMAWIYGNLYNQITQDNPNA